MTFRTDGQIVTDYLAWQHALRGGGSTEDEHRALVKEDRPKPTLEEAQAAAARLHDLEQTA